MSKDNIAAFCNRAKADGFNSISPSIAHYRWNFLEYMDEIASFMRNLVEIAHEKDLTVWEHHSVVMLSELRNDMAYKDWRFADMVKRDYRNNEPYYMSHFKGMVFCCSNSNFKQAYFNMVKQFVIDIPVDIYMPDDMGAACDYFDCCCHDCRRLFHENTGYTAPEPCDMDDNFFGNMLNPAWRAWIRFRSTRVGLFLNELRNYLDINGRKDLPMTVCNVEDLTSYQRFAGTDHEEHNVVGKLGLGFFELWTQISLVYNWSRNLIEQQALIGVGEVTDIPYVTHAYPRSNEEAVFSFARDMTVGMNTNVVTSRNIYLNNDYQCVNNFSTKYSDRIYGNKNIAEIGVVFSRNTRDFYGDDVFTRTNLESHCDELVGWCENILKTNSLYKIIAETYVETKDLSGFKIIILPNCACMSDKMAKKLSDFVCSGGTLVATHESSLFDETGNKLSNFQLSNVLGVNYIDTKKGCNCPMVVNTSPKDVVDFRKSLHYGLSRFNPRQYDEGTRDAIFGGITNPRIKHHAPMALVEINSDSAQVLAHSPIFKGIYVGYAAVVANSYGKGKSLYFSGLPGYLNHTFETLTRSQYGEDQEIIIDESIEEYEKIISNVISWAHNGQKLLNVKEPIKGLVLNLMKSKEGKHYLHLLAAPCREATKDGRRLEKYMAKHAMDSDSGTGWANNTPRDNPEMWGPDIRYVDLANIEIELDSRVAFNEAELVSIDLPGKTILKISAVENKKIIHIPADSFKRYAVIELR
jgi:hypothetical protein